MELREALSQISEIRAQVARTETFRGYRSLTVGFTGALAFAAAGLQPLVAPDPAEHARPYLVLWVSAAALSLIAAGAELCVRGYASSSMLARQLTSLAVEQFLPCIAAGAVVTVAVATRAVDRLWMLPGLWSVLFGLGIFASCRLLPRMTFFVGMYYLFCGAVLLIVAEPAFALSPVAMAMTFGVGQLSAAAILYFHLERSYDSAQ